MTLFLDTPTIDTLDRSCLTLFLDTLAAPGGTSDTTLVLDTLAGHSFFTLLRDTLAARS